MSHTPEISQDDAWDLLDACKEMREVCSAAMRVIAAGGGCQIREFTYELSRLGIKKGFGVRAQDAVAKAEGKEE